MDNYEIDVLNGMDWKYAYDSEDINKIDKYLYELTKENIKSRVLLNGNVLCFLNGSEHRYWYWKNRYVRNKGLNFDYTKSYYTYQKKKKLED